MKSIYNFLGLFKKYLQNKCIINLKNQKFFTFRTQICQNESKVRISKESNS